MLFGQDRDQLRRFYLQAWQKRNQGLPLEPLEALVAEVIAIHPEYHTLLGDEEASLGHTPAPDEGEGNPFLHMGMHIAIREQLGSARPAGIVELYRRLAQRLNSEHEAEHKMMECLGQVLWEAQRQGLPPDEKLYLDCLKRL